MSFDPNSEWGLRFRLRVAIRQGYSYDSLAIILHVDAATLETYLTDPTYVLSSGDTANALAHIFDVEAPDVFYDRQPQPGNCIITYVESAYWTQEQLDGVMVPDRATTFKVHFLSPSDEHRVMSTPLYYLTDRTPQEAAASACEGHLERLVCIVFYEYVNVVA